MVETVDSVLAHYGVKGMKWGRRRTRAQIDSDSEDAATAKAVKAKIRSNGGKTDPLSNQELESLLKRMDLEQRYSKLNSQTSTLQKGQKTVKEIMSVVNTVNQVSTALNSPAVKQVKKDLDKIKNLK